MCCLGGVEIGAQSVLTGLQKDGEQREVLTLIVSKTQSIMNDVGYALRRW